MARERTTLRPPGNTEEGSTLVLYAVLLSALFVCLVLGYGVAGAMTIRTNQESALSAVREIEMAPAMALAAKNSDDPGTAIARKMVAGLRDAGFSDAIDVWFYEVPARELTPERRLYAYEVVLTTPYDVPFGGAVGIRQVNVASSVVSSAMPYSEFEAWRPSMPRNGVFRAAAGSSAITYESKVLSAMPEGIRGEIASDLETL